MYLASRSTLFRINSIWVITAIRITSYNVCYTKLLRTADGDILADVILFAVGRVGSRSFAQWCRKNSIEMTNNQVDIGVRVELPAIVWEHFSKKIYEPKIWYRSKSYGDVTRMFCFNERGNVVMENTDGVLTVNGHSYKRNNFV